jgi:hypothetical protein
MALSGFTGFVAEQALGIVVGAAAVVAAPVVVPKLRTLGKGVANGTRAAAEKAGQVGSVVGPPVMQTGFRVYRRVSNRALWYGEWWSALMSEVQAEQVPEIAAGAVTPQAILTGLPRARVVSDVPGRARLRVNRLRGKPDLAIQTAEALLTVPGLRHVEVSPHTGSVLIGFDKRRYRSLDDLLNTIAAW